MDALEKVLTQLGAVVREDVERIGLFHRELLQEGLGRVSEVTRSAVEAVAEVGKAAVAAVQREAVKALSARTFELTEIKGELRKLREAIEARQGQN